MLKCKMNRVDFSGYGHITYDLIKITENSRKDIPEIYLIKHLFKDRIDLRIIELCSGTGRLVISLLPFASKIWAIDGSKIMQKFLFEKARNLCYSNRNKISAIVNDICEVEFPEEIDLIIITDGSFGYLLDEKDQRLVLEKCNKSLKDAGILIVYTFNSFERMRRDQVNKKYWIKNIYFDENNGLKIIQYRKSYSQGNSDIIITEYRNQFYYNCTFNKVSNFMMRIRLNRLHELVELFKEENFIIKNIYADYFLNPFDSDSDYIFELHKC